MAAGLFRANDWDVSVFERATGDLAGRGAGIGLSAELLEIMERIGAQFEPSAGVAHNSSVWMDEDGGIVFEQDRSTVGSTWPRVYRALRDSVPPDIYRQSMTLTKVDQDAHAVSALFSDGSRETGDLLIAADGMLSTVRRQFLPEVEPRYANYVGWRGLIEERDVPGATLDAIGEHLVFCFPEGEMLLTMAVPGAGDDVRPGHRRVYFIWYRPVAGEALADLFTDATGKNHGVSIPPPLIREELIGEMRQRATEIFAPAVADIVNRVPQPLLQAISDMESPRLAFGRVALIGDAAFVARPHTAGGVSKAGLDAQCLVDSLVTANGHIAPALEHYERERLSFGRRLVAHSRYLGAYLEGQTKPPDQRTRQELHRDEKSIILDYGAPDLLRKVDAAALEREPSAIKQEFDQWQAR